MAKNYTPNIRKIKVKGLRVKTKKTKRRKKR